jgi:hypothetical protein
MRWLVWSFVVFMLMAVVSAEGVAAQDAVPTSEQSAPAVQYMLTLGATAGTAPATIIRYDDPQRAELERKVRRNRGALIGSSVAAAVGLPLWTVAIARQCSKLDIVGGTEVRVSDLNCTRRGKVMRATGLTLFWGGASGMLISGIMLAVRKGQLRDLGHLVENPKSRALRWDPASSQFVF